MDIQVKESKNVTTLIFYATPERLAEAKAAVEEMKPILEKHGFKIEVVRESLTKRPR